MSVYLGMGMNHPALKNKLTCSIGCRSPCAAAAAIGLIVAVNLVCTVAAAAAAGVVVGLLRQRFRFANMMTIAGQEAIEGRVCGCNASSPIVVASDLDLGSCR